jgi:2'-5' RNA ligase
VTDQPLLVTLALDDPSQSHLQALRDAHFPPERNVVPAHVSLFHALPGEELSQVLSDVREVAGRPPLTVQVTGVRSLGRGTALVLESPELLVVRAELAQRWRDWLTRQDAQRFSPHVTVQNKVDPAQARALLGQLQAEFSPWSMTGTGLHVWRYLGGPWELVETVPFAR